MKSSTWKCLLAVSALAAAALLAGCSGSSSATSSPSPTVQTDQETTANRDSQPSLAAAAGASANQQPDQDQPRAGGYQLQPFVSLPDLEWMVGFEVLPGESEALVTVKTGQVWRVSLTGQANPQLFGDISARLIAQPHVEEGLLGLALSPSFESDGEVYLHYNAGEPRRSVLSRFQSADGTLDVASEEILLEVEQPYGNHKGGHITFGPDGYLYMALGDGGDAFDPHDNGQNLGNLLSSILRIDVSGETGYTIPPDNPLVNQPGARGEIYAYGLRNPWRFSFDSATGALWAGDVGQDDWEEINLIVPGGNYGWSVMEGEQCLLPQGCSGVDTVAPRAVHGRESNNQAIVGGYVYRGSLMPELDGWLVYGDWGLGKIWALDTANQTSAPITLMDTNVPIMSFAQLPDGEIVVVGFSDAIYRLVRN